MYALQPEKASNGCLRTLATIGALALVLAVIMVAIIVFPSLRSSSISATESRTPAQALVTYRVTTDRDSSQWPSCFGFDTTFEVAHGTSQQRANICDGARHVEVGQFYGAQGDFVYLSVQNDKFAARIGCEIYINGKLVYQTHSSGQYVIASCSGSIP